MSEASEATILARGELLLVNAVPSATEVVYIFPAAVVHAGSAENSTFTVSK